MQHEWTQRSCWKVLSNLLTAIVADDQIAAFTRRRQRNHQDPNVVVGAWCTLLQT